MSLCVIIKTYGALCRKILRRVGFFVKNLKGAHSLHRSQLFNQYFKRVLIYFSFPCLLFVLVLYSYYMFHNDYITRESFQSTVNYTTQSLNNMFDEIDKKYYLVNSDKSVQNCLFLDERSFYLPSNRQHIVSINTLLSYSIDTSNIIDSIYLYSFNNKYVYSVDKTLCVSSNHFYAFADKAWLAEYQKNPQLRIIFGGYNDCYKADTVSVVYQMQSNGVTTGLLVFNITEGSLRNLLIAGGGANSTNIMLTNGNSKILSTFTNEELERTAITAEPLKKIKNTMYYSTEARFPQTTMYTAVTFPSNASGFSIALIVGFILLFAIVIPVILAFSLANSFYESISNIVSYIKEIDPNETDINNEMDFIQSRLKNVITLSKSFEQSIAQSIVETQQAQLISLQTQLNPHFLFNTLNALSLMNSTDSNKDDFELLIRNLSNLLSYCLNTTKSIVTISDEVEYSMYYVNMEEIKYNSKIRLRLDIPKEFMSYSIPKFTFQPLLENAFKHGFKYQFGEDSLVMLSARTENDTLIIRFSDNGAGITASAAEKINAELSQGHFPQNQHIGIYNVNKRIQLIYGSGFGCRIYPAEGGGALVVIKIPVNK